jgi:AraC family transcriptional regulator
MSRPEPSADVPHHSVPLRVESAGFAVAVLPALPYDVTYRSDHHVIGFTFERQQGIGAFAGDRRRPFSADPWRLAFTPAGCEVTSASDRGGEYLVLIVAPATLVRLAPAIVDRALPQFTNVAEPGFTALAIALRRAACAGARAAGLRLDTLVAAAVERLAMQICSRPAPEGAARGMTPRRTARILDYLDAHLDGTVRLADLAREVALSEAYLARAFKAATGTTLHTALVERRIARARRLIAAARPDGDELRLADIAMACGFSSHAHMTTAFRRVLGVTPGAWARAVLDSGRRADRGIARR